jgi:hypothetical protein
MKNARAFHQESRPPPLRLDPKELEPQTPRPTGLDFA